MANNQRKEFEITHVVNAPRDLVFKMWTEAEHLLHWWGPKGSTLKIDRLDLRPGGLFLYSMQTPDGGRMWGRFKYGEIKAPEKLVFISSFSNEEGEMVRAPFSEHFPLEIHNTVTFKENGNKTTVYLHGGPINGSDEEYAFYEAMFDSMQQGFKGTFEQLETYLENENLLK